MITTPIINQLKVNWRQVGLFIGLTFGFTYALDLLLLSVGGYGSASTMIFLQLQMLLPAFFAIFLGMFVFTDSPFYFRNPMPDGRRDRARGFFYLYMALILFFVDPGGLSVSGARSKHAGGTIAGHPDARWGFGADPLPGLQGAGCLRAG